MKVINKTWWNTRDLKRIISRVATQEVDLPRRKFLKAEIRYGHKPFGVSGYAWLGGNLFVIRVSKVRVDPIAFARIVAHEIGHCIGLEHHRMRGTKRYARAKGSNEFYAWAREYTIAKKERA